MFSLKNWIIILFICFFGFQGTSQVKREVSVQTQITTVTGETIEDDLHTISTRFYDIINAANPFAEVENQVQTSRGLANLELEVPGVYQFKTDHPVFLGLSINGGPELVPRLKIAPSLYSYSAGAVNGKDNIFPYEGNVGIGTLNPSAGLHVSGSVKLDGLQTFNTSPSMFVGLDNNGNLGKLTLNTAFTGLDKLELAYGTGGLTLDSTGVSVVPSSGVGGIQIAPNMLDIFNTTTGNPGVLLNGDRQSTFVFGLTTPINNDKYISISPNPDFGFALMDTSGNYYHHFRPDGQAYHSQGLTVGGTLVANQLAVSGEKNFKIDHPLDPENMYLVHRSIESDDRLNFYNGNVALNKKGEAEVELPAWFEELNTDFRYQLTAIGAPGPNLYISQKISDNCFKISGGKKGMEVSWQVTGIRKDKYAGGLPANVEVFKENALVSSK